MLGFLGCGIQYSRQLIIFLDQIIAKKCLLVGWKVTYKGEKSRKNKQRIGKENCKNVRKKKSKKGEREKGERAKRGKRAKRGNKRESKNSETFFWCSLNLRLSKT